MSRWIDADDLENLRDKYIRGEIKTEFRKNL